MPVITRKLAAAGLVLVLGASLAACSSDDEDEATTTTAASTETTEAETTETTEAAAGDTIADLAVATPELSTLVAAATAADLVSVLSGPGTYTVFAPTNDAFAAIQSTVDTLLKPENKAKLTSVLTYHVLQNQVLSSDLKEGDQTVTTVLGETLVVNLTGAVVTITDSTGAKATVSTADVTASNGVVHIIDKVLIPAAAA
jgi:uncharacterized surface protein with fasciclin (FAS1) repeats